MNQIYRFEDRMYLIENANVDDSSRIMAEDLKGRTFVSVDSIINRKTTDLKNDAEVGCYTAVPRNEQKGIYHIAWNYGIGRDEDVIVTLQKFDFMYMASLDERIKKVDNPFANKSAMPREVEREIVEIALLIKGIGLIPPLDFYSNGTLDS